MTQPTTRRRSFSMAGALAVLGVVAVVILASGFGRTANAGDPTPSATPRPSAPPTPVPSIPTTPKSSVGPSAPVEHPPIEGDITVDLENQTGHFITATVRDNTETLVDVLSGRPGSGMSVFWHDIAARNLDARTIRVTWVGVALDDQVHVDIAFEGGKYLIEIVQTGPLPNTDASGYDRELILRFTQPVVADEVIGGVADRTPE